jgi:two-component system sensor histidine kinase KdpD
MDQDRPSPESMLLRAEREASSSGRRRLKIFFGATPGVGKTYAMLEAARVSRSQRVDVVVGWVETHGRKETAQLLEGLESLPPRSMLYRGIQVLEFDLDAALERMPKLLLVDELAHSNVPGTRHARRWQDVEELLDAGIDVWTTLNVQHVESLNGVVASITGVVVNGPFRRSSRIRSRDLGFGPAQPVALLVRSREVRSVDRGRRRVRARGDRPSRPSAHKSTMRARSTTA